ncbi:MAG: alpha/beta hydrolase-fold protein [Verrucomicrobiota bacterium]
MGRDIKAVAVLPPEYQAHPEKKYPVLYALHGYDAPYDVYSEMAPLRQALATKPMIVVSFDADRGSFYLDSPILQTDYLRPDKAGNSPTNQGTPVKSLFTTFFFDEFIPAINKCYRINSHQRMLTGFSMGGFGALHYMLAKPDQFVSVSSLSGFFPSLDDPELKDVIERLLGPPPEGPKRYRLLDLYSRIRPLRKPTNWKLPPVYLHCGSEDRLLEQNHAMHKFLKEQDVACEFLETPGKHNWAFWKSASAGIIDFHWRSLQSETVGRK